LQVPNKGASRFSVFIASEVVLATFDPGGCERVVAQHGVDGLYMCTLIAGGILVILGITGMGNAVKYIPRPIVVGFTNGIALLVIALGSWLATRTRAHLEDFL